MANVWTGGQAAAYPGKPNPRRSLYDSKVNSDTLTGVTAR
jgi:hypothetical protein